MTKRNKNSNKHTTLQKDVAETGGGHRLFFLQGQINYEVTPLWFWGCPHLQRTAVLRASRSMVGIRVRTAVCSVQCACAGKLNSMTLFAGALQIKERQNASTESLAYCRPIG